MGFLAVTFFDTYFRCFFGRFGLQMPLVARYCDHVGEFWVLKGFWEFGEILFCGGVRVRIFQKYFSRPEKYFPDFFLLKKFPVIFFAGSKFLFCLAMTGALRSQTAPPSK